MDKPRREKRSTPVDWCRVLTALCAVAEVVIQLFR
jgi:hypothetical protein